MGRRSRRSPRDHVISGDWPAAELDNNPSAERAQRFARALADATDSLSLRGVEAATGVDHDTVARILRGDTWCDIDTLARLEDGLAADLWPSRQRKPKN